MIESYITSSIEGRLRIRHPFIRDAGLADAIFTFLKGQTDLENISVNIRTGSVLIEYDPAKNTQDRIIGNLEECAMAYCVENDYLEQLLEYEENNKIKSACGICIPAVWAFDKIKARIFIRRGMFALLVSSVGLIAFNQERGHAVAAGLFTTLAAAHLYINRKRF